MKTTWMLVGLLAVVAPLAGCVDSSDSVDFDFKPGANFTPTGKTVHIKMWVEDLVKSEIYPGFEANLWAYCAEPADPNDEYSAKAIEYRNPTGVVEQLNSDNEFVIKEASNGKCSVPGPQLRVKQGDNVIVDFKNDHFHPHTIHWHGQYVPWESDGVPGVTQDSVVPTTSFRYEFVAKRAGTLWYHCHVDVQFHVMQGLYGVMIVEPQDETWEPENVDHDYTWVLGNLDRNLVQRDPAVTDPHAKHKHGAACGASGIPGCNNPRVTIEPDVFMINGRSLPNTMMDNQTLVVAKEDERVRLRLVNAGETFETIHTHGHDMFVTHRDGNPLHPNARFWVDTITIGPGERYDVIIDFDQIPGIWVAHTHVENHVTNDFQGRGGMFSMLVYESFLPRMGEFVGVENFGGIPYAAPVFIPDDIKEIQMVNLEDSAAQSTTLGSMQFPLELACAAQELEVYAELFFDTPVVGALGESIATDITMNLLGPDGTVLLSQAMADGTARFLVEDLFMGVSDLKIGDFAEGNYTIEFEGTNLDADAQVHLRMQYFEELYDVYESSKFTGREPCPNSPFNPYDEFQV